MGLRNGISLGIRKKHIRIGNNVFVWRGSNILSGGGESFISKRPKSTTNWNLLDVFLTSPPSHSRLFQFHIAIHCTVSNSTTERYGCTLLFIWAWQSPAGPPTPPFLQHVSLRACIPSISAESKGASSGYFKNWCCFDYFQRNDQNLAFSLVASSLHSRNAVCCSVLQCSALQCIVVRCIENKSHSAPLAIVT